MTAIDRPARTLAEVAPAVRRAVHLGDYSFQFDEAAVRPPHPVERPHAGERWTLAQTLQEIRLRRSEVLETVGGLRVRHAHRLPALVAAVREHEGAVRLWLRLGAGTPARGWDDETWLWWTWLRSGVRPAEPVALRPGVSVTDWDRFVTSAADRIAAGPDAPCAESLRRDLGNLFARHADLSAPVATSAWRPSRAA